MIPKHDVAQHAVVHGANVIKAGSGAAVGGGLWAWFGANHSQIGALCAMVGAFCAISGLIYAIYKDRRVEPRDPEEEFVPPEVLAEMFSDENLDQDF